MRLVRSSVGSPPRSCIAPATDCLAIDRVPGELGGDRAFPDDKDAGAEGRQLLRFRGKGEDANSVEGSLAKEFEYFLPGGRVDAAGRVVEHQHLGLQRKPLCEDRLLLVAAAELSKKGFGCRRPHVEEPYDPLDELGLATWLQPEAREIRQQNVFRNG